MRLLLLLGLSSQLLAPALASYGGHDLFTSLGQLSELWKNDKEIVAGMQKTIDDMEHIKEVFQRYIESHKAAHLDEEVNFEYLGQPLNGYFLIRHVAYGWGEIRNKLMGKLNSTYQTMESLVERENTTKLPDPYDVSGAAFGLVRLHSLYKLNATEMFQNGIVATEKTNTGVNIKARSMPAVAIPSAWDAFLFAQQAFKHGFYRSTVDAFPFVKTKMAEESALDKAAFEAFDYDAVLNETIVDEEMKKSIAYHDQILDRRGPVGNGHRTHTLPLDKKMRKKKKYKKPKAYNLTMPIRTEEEAAQSRLNEDQDLVLRSQYMEMLCAGEPIRTPEEDKDLRSFYAHNNSPWLRLGPMKVEVRNKKPYLAVLRQLLYEHECDNITQFLSPTLNFPPGRMGGRHGGRNDWTMKNTWPVEDDNIHLEKMTRRVEHISGLFAASNKKQSDAFMCGNYGIGGHYGIHPDFYDYNEHNFRNEEKTINRISTVMTIFEAPQAGGATVFPFMGVSIFPEKGSAAFWFNTKSDAVPDQLTLHSACPVLLGQKWIGNKWIRYRAQWNKRPCSLEADGRMQGPLPENGDTYR